VRYAATERRDDGGDGDGDDGDGDDGDGDVDEDARATERLGPPERDDESASDGERERGRERGGCERARGVVVVR